MAWTKTSTAQTHDGFTTYMETAAYGNDAFVASSALPTIIGGFPIMGVQTSDGSGTLDSGVAISLQVSPDGTNWATLENATVIALTNKGSRAFVFNLDGKWAPYMRLYSPLTAHTGTNVVWRLIVKN
jgi:hypothetical protein